MNDTLGFIFVHGNDSGMKELSESRAMGAIPFGGRYRLIDFELSNMVNSGIRNIAVLTQNNYHSLMDHLGSGKEWDLDRKRDGLFIFPPYLSDKESTEKNLSHRMSALNNVMSYIRRSTQKYALISNGDIVSNHVYDEMLEYHISKNAYITVMCTRGHFSDEALKCETFLSTDKNGRVDDVMIAPGMPLLDLMFTGTFIMEKSLLEFLVAQCVAHNRFSFTKDVLQGMLTGLDIYAWEYKGYLRRIDSIESFYDANRELLDASVRADLFRTDCPIRTKVRDDAPTFYEGENEIVSSLLADGCVIGNGAKIINSVLFRGVRVGANTVIRDSIIMQDCVIGADAEIGCSILDKNATVTNGVRVSGYGSHPFLAGKASVI